MVESKNLFFLLLEGFSSYFIGSIPFGFLIIRIFCLGNIQNMGSGNIGSTNVFRVGGKKLAFLALLCDTLKGFIPTILFSDFLSSFCAFIGHIFPVWLKFRGGKGVATFLGILFGISWMNGIFFSFIWFFFLYLSKYASIASLIAVLINLIISFFYLSKDSFFMIFLMSVIIVIKHNKNIIRIFQKMENRINL